MADTTPASSIRATEAAVAICPPRVYAVGGAIAANRRLSWIPQGLPGWLPCQGYVVCDGPDRLLIDTGLIVHQDSVRRGVMDLMDRAGRHAVVLTRREPDTMMNLPWLVREFGITSVRCRGPIDPFDFVEKLDEAHASAQIKEALGIAVDFLTPDSPLALGETRLEVIRPLLRILATDWIYDPVSKSLFTSDTWGFVRTDGASVCPIATNDADISAAAVRDHLAAKFDWLCGIDTRPIADDLRNIMDGRVIDRVCPSYGCVIEGRNTVRRLLDATIEALENLAQEERPPVMKAFFNRIENGKWSSRAGQRNQQR